MMYERFIAQRYMHSHRQFRFINIIMLVSVIGITVGVAALIIVLSVFNGFNTVVTQVLVGFDPHVRIEAAQGGTFLLSDDLTQALRSDRDISAWSPFIAGKALLMTASSNRVVVVRGVVDTMIERVSGVKSSIVLGTFDLGDSSAQPGIVLGLALADRLGVAPGSRLTVVSPVGVDAMIMQYGQPLMKQCEVRGLYDSNNKDYDAHYAFVSVETARQLFNAGEGVSGIEIRLRNIGDSERVKARLEGVVGNDHKVLTWYDLHKDLYSVMKIERWSAYIILCLIVGVASFNVLGSLTMSVVEKRRDIGILRALGSTRASITRVFMFEGIFVGTLGTVIGLLVGLVVCYVQIAYQVFPLDPSVYIIPAIPVELRWTDLLAVGGASMLLSACASFYPGFRAARLTPVEAIRWE